MGLSPSEASSLFFIVTLTAGISSLLLSVASRQPIQITPSLAAWVFLAAVGARYSLGEITGAVIVTSVIVLALGIVGASERLMRWLPLPIVMGVFAGSVLDLVIAMFEGLDREPLVIGVALLAFLLASAARSSWLPPVAAAALAGTVAAAASGSFEVAALTWEAPELHAVTPRFGLESLLSLTLPLIIMVFGVGNVQGFGFLLQQGYRPPMRVTTIAVGVVSLINGVFGALPASLGRTSIALVAGDEAGPPEGRYNASAIGAIAMLLLGLTAGAANSLVSAFPPGFIVSIAGLAILRTLLSAVRATVESPLQLGPFVALLIAASPLEWFGVGAAFWGFIGGMLVAFLLEREALIQRLRT